MSSCTWQETMVSAWFGPDMEGNAAGHRQSRINTDTDLARNVSSVSICFTAGLSQGYSRMTLSEQRSWHDLFCKQRWEMYLSDAASWYQLNDAWSLHCTSVKNYPHSSNNPTFIRSVSAGLLLKYQVLSAGTWNTLPYIVLLLLLWQQYLKNEKRIDMVSE